MKIPPSKSCARTASYLLGTLLSLSACASDVTPTGPQADDPPLPPNALIALTCTGNVQNSTLACQTPASARSLISRRNMLGGDVPGPDKSVIGGQNLYVRLTSNNVSYDSGTEIFQFDVTIQNLLNEAIGSINGEHPDTAGIKVFFYQSPVATSGSGTISILNNDGTGTFTATNQDYYKYDTILAKNETSTPKTWQFSVPSTVSTFSFTVYLAATPQALLVINEFLVNPGGTITDANGEWFEIYNAGTRSVEMQGFLLSDSSAAGRRPYYLIPSSVIVPAGGYVTFGNTTNTTNNGGVQIDHAYGTFMQFANSLDALKISYVVGTDTVTIDYVRYSSPGVSALNGVSRELKNPALDNLNMDGSNWGDASVTSVYGTGGRGTPKAQNSAFEP